MRGGHKKSKVLSNSVSQVLLAPLGVQASGTERNLGIGYSSGKRVATFVRRARLKQEDPRQVVGPTTGAVGNDRASVGVEGKSLRASSRAVPFPGCVVPGEALGWEKGLDGVGGGRNGT